MIPFLKSLFTSTVQSNDSESEKDDDASSIYDSECSDSYKTPARDIETENNDEGNVNSQHRLKSPFVPICTNNKQVKGALYLVKGLNYECLMSQSESHFDKDALVFKDTENKIKHLTFRYDRISYVRQHLPDAFQFLIRSPLGGGDEYGFQVESLDATLQFRALLFRKILETCLPVYGIECALAEYDTQNKEFVIISKAASASVFSRKSDNDHYLVLSITSEIETKKPCVVAMEALTKEMQIWPSPQSYQITFWASRYPKANKNKTMFLMEMNPSTVPLDDIQSFFRCLGNVLQDKTFLFSSNTRVSTDQSSQIEYMEDTDFDLGHTGDPNVRTKWRKSQRFSETRTESEASDSDNEYRVDSYPLYSKSSKDEQLTHRFMEVGANRTFVCRGSQPLKTLSYKDQRNFQKSDTFQLKVYKPDEHDPEESLTSVGAIDGKKFIYEGNAFIPERGLLHQQEKKILLAPERDLDGDVYMMDLQSEKVVQKWNSKNMPIDTLFSSTKHGQSTNDPTFLCTNPQNLFLMDTRLKNKNAKTMSYSYKTNPQISAGTTDSSGHILLGSHLGDLRLFDGEQSSVNDGFKRAKTMLQTVKEPIIAVDVTNDGSWILATTKTFLVVFPTRLSGTNRTGFETPLGQHKPLPRYLMLSAEDVIKYGITEIDFAPARFDAEEASIVTSTGNMAVVWDFGTVKRGKPFYSVRFAADTIKDVQVASESANVVVAYSTAVGLFGTEKKHL